MSARDPVPPFPQEPAFGSAEAVEQAAETIQRWAMRGPVQQIALVPVPTGNLVRFEDAKSLLEQRDALADALEAIRGAEGWTDSYCEFCQAHAPKKESGVPCGPIPHFEECARAEAEEALRKAGR